MKKSVLRKVINYLPPFITKIIYVICYYIRDGKKIRKCKSKLSNYLSIITNNSLSKQERKSFKEYCTYMYRAGAEKYIDSYFICSDFRCIQRVLPNQISIDEPILICCVKDDINRIKLIIEHHLAVGIKHFVFVDNGSSDGTLDYLKSQNVDIYQTFEKYHAGCKAAWVKKIEDIYGYNRWYLIVDSDELFTYPGIERHPISDLVDYAKRKGLKRVRCLLLDMYSDQLLFQTKETVSSDNIIRQYRFFDTESYYLTKDCKGPVMRGGPRKRVFESKSGHSQPLTKYPLSFVEKEDLWADHTPIPFSKNFASPCITVLRHYKFLPEDLDKFKTIIINGNYSNGSREYKQYMSKFDEDSNLSFWDVNSCEYINSDSLKKIAVLEEIHWDA